MLSRKFIAAAAVVAACSYVLSFHAQAVTTNWIDGGGGRCTDAANWDNGEPVLGDTAVFNLGADVAYNVTFSGGGIFDPPQIYVIDFLRVHSNNVTCRDNSSPFITRPGFAV